MKGTVLICRLSDTLKGTVPVCRLSDTLKGEVPIPGADGYAYGGQRDGQTDDVEDPVDRLQTRDAGLGTWGAGAEAARFHGGGKFGGTPDGEHQQSERLGEGTGDGVTVTKAARTLGQAECAPIFLQQRKHAQSGQSAVYESR